ncbi:hypothetical protein JCM33374_g3777 [Metschnikowia sp. JCM 33374]|nr:hypothetical protein JCM33374_g3777 [Metschnikowia sp. JCM 33374]
MSISRGTSIDRKLIRRGVKKANLFKENQVLIGAEPKNKTHKKKRIDRHVAVESPEFELLVRLYVPANLLIKNNKVSMKQLTAHLPVLVDDSFPELNFELHIFLSSLVTAYVSSWYLKKLNTENLTFIIDVYETLCMFVKDVSSRISRIVESPRLLAIINELAEILDGHLRDNAVETGIPAYASLLIRRCSHSILESPDLGTLRKKYLSESHISFDKRWSHPKDYIDYYSRQSFETEQSFDAGLPHSQKVEESPCQIYLRVLVKEILSTVFSEPNTKMQGPQSSVIVTNFLTILLADLVIAKLVTKLSSPDFLISTVLGGVSEKLSSSLKDKIPPNNKPHTSSRFEKIKSVSSSVYSNISSASVALRHYLWKSADMPTIFFSPLFSLIDGITNFSGRKPVLASFMKSSRSIMFSLGALGTQVESIIGAFLLDKVGQSSVVDDTNLAHLIETLRCSLFDKTSESSSVPAPPKTISEVRDCIFELLHHQLKKRPSVSLSLMWFKNESEEDIKASIESFVRIFAEDPHNNHTDFPGKNSDMNLLLVMKILDCIVQNIYPEMSVNLHGDTSPHV